MRIVVISSMRDEGPHIIEWLAHHIAIGVDHFVICSNDCLDGTPTLLDRLDAADVLSHVRNKVPQDKTPQWSALRSMMRHPALLSADWVLHIDCDEFVNLAEPLASLQDLLSRVGDSDGVTLPWRLFGASGHMTRQQSTLMGYKKTISADAHFPMLGRFFKTLYRAKGPFQKPGIHRPKQKRGAAPRLHNGSGSELDVSFCTDDGQILFRDGPAARELVQLNHYSLRSAQDFIVKRARGLPNRQRKPIDMLYWVERNFNEIEDSSILRHWPETRKNMSLLRDLPGVDAAEKETQKRQDAIFEEQMRYPEEARLYTRLALAATSVAPDAAQAQRLQRIYGAALAQQNT